MSRPTPSVPFPFEAFAHERGREREAEKRGLWKGILALMKSCDVIEKAGFCPITLTGTVLLHARDLDDAAYLVRAYEVGLAAAKGFEVPEPQPKIEPLQVVAGTEPEPALLARLAAEGFRRMSGEGVEPVIYMGHGLLAAWKALQSNTVRITKVDLPGGAILGMNVVVADEGGGAVPEGESEAGSADARSNSADPASTGEAAIASTDASGAMDGREQAAASTAAASAAGTHGASARQARTAVARPSPASATAEPARPYRWATIRAPVDRPDWALHRATDAERDALVLAAVKGQGPVDRDLAIEAVRHGLDVRAILTNGRSRLAGAIDRLVADGAVIVTEGGFYDLPGRLALPPRPQRLRRAPAPALNPAARRDRRGDPRGTGRGRPGRGGRCRGRRRPAARLPAQVPGDQPRPRRTDQTADRGAGRGGGRAHDPGRGRLRPDDTACGSPAGWGSPRGRGPGGRRRRYRGRSRTPGGGLAAHAGRCGVIREPART